MKTLIVIVLIMALSAHALSNVMDTHEHISVKNPTEYIKPVVLLVKEKELRYRIRNIGNRTKVTLT